MLKAVIYGYMNNLYSCRRIASALKRDIHFIWLAGYEQPDFNTINRFRNCVKEEINEVFTRLVLVLAERGFVTLDVEYIDGTKIESKANRYTFVWRKSTERNRARLLDKIKALLGQVDESIAQENSTEGDVRSFTAAGLKNLAGGSSMRHWRPPPACDKRGEGMPQVAQETGQAAGRTCRQARRIRREAAYPGREELIFQDRSRRHVHADEGGRHEKRPDKTGV